MCKKILCMQPCHKGVSVRNPEPTSSSGSASDTANAFPFVLLSFRKKEKQKEKMFRPIAPRARLRQKTVGVKDRVGGVHRVWTSGAGKGRGNTSRTRKLLPLLVFRNKSLCLVWSTPPAARTNPLCTPWMSQELGQPHSHTWGQPQSSGGGVNPAAGQGKQGGGLRAAPSGSSGSWRAGGL